MELTFLGTSSGVPTIDRNVTGVALRLGGHWDLFDCGEATQHQLLRTPLSLAKLQRVFISHLHGDHCFGLFGLLASRSMGATTDSLVVFGPHGLRAMVAAVMEASSTHLTQKLTGHEVGPEGGQVHDSDRLSVEAVPLTHRVTSFAWFLREADRPAEFDVDAARAAGVPDGPLFGQLQRGKSVDLESGGHVEPQEVMGPVRPGRRIVIAGDNSNPDALFEHTGGVDVAVHEATYTEAVLAALGNDRGHSTAARVASAAARHQVRNLVLTHFSPRYGDGNDGSTIGDLRAEASQHFDGNLHLANDFDRFEISRDGATLRASTTLSHRGR